jgi:DNA polymerase III subunit delta
MKINPNQLKTKLANNKPFAAYYVCGDEPLLVQEACDSIRTYAKKQDFSERERFDTNAGFDLSALDSSQNNLSLFAEKKLIECHLHQAPNKALQEYFLDYLENPNENTILLISSKRLSNAAKQAWYKALDKQGLVIECWPIKTQELPQWLAGRLTKAGFQADSDAINYLANLSEGNLLAANQQIEKLALTCPLGNLDLAMIKEVAQDSARFDVFQLADSALAGNSTRCAKILTRLQTDGTASILALWAVTREIRTLLKLSSGINTYIFPSKKVLYQKSARRLDKKVLENLLAKAANTDLMIKGLKSGNPWDELLDICVAMK